MKQLARRLIALAVVFSIFLCVVPQGNARGAGSHRPPLKPRPQIAYVAIASVDATAMTITTEPKNSAATGTKTYKITPKTKVKVNGNDAKLDDLKPGMQVRIGAGMDASIAEEITATPAPAVVK